MSEGDHQHPLGRYAAVFHALAEARMAAEDWLEWWERHGQEVKARATPGVFLRLKPRTGGGHGPSFAAHYSQEAACQVLDLLGVGYERSDRYHRDGQRAFEQLCREQAAATAARATEFAPTINALAGRFPRFARFLKANTDDIDQCRPGLDGAALARLEQDLGLRLPETYRTFLRCAREIVVGDTLQMTTAHPFTHNSAKVSLPTQGMLCIGEYWLDADGDQVLFDLRQEFAPDAADDPPVLYYDHGQPAVRPIANSFTAWIEALPRTLAER
ncbi:SMI1/KNR4 family protein [Actinomycetes bacterium KLBMP 9797]